MAFVKVPGLRGKVYVPEDATGRPPKHFCKDCFTCQQCQNDRCQVCLRRERDNCNSDAPRAPTAEAIDKAGGSTGCGERKNTYRSHSSLTNGKHEKC